MILKFLTSTVLKLTRFITLKTELIKYVYSIKQLKIHENVINNNIQIVYY